MSAINFPILSQQEARLYTFKKDVLIPVIVETTILNTPDASSFQGTNTVNYGRSHINFFNTRSCGWNSFPRYGFNYAPVNINIGQSQPEVKVHDRRKKEKEDDKTKQALAVATIAASVIGILYTGYQMAYSIKQTLGSQTSIERSNSAEKGIVFLRSRLNFADQSKLNSVVDFRNEYLTRAFNRNLADVIEDIGIIAGLSFVAFGAAMFAAPLIGLGSVMVVASIIAKFVTHTIWPRIEDDEDLKDRSVVVKRYANELLKDLKVGEPVPPSDDDDNDALKMDALYPNLSTISEQVAAQFNIPAQNLNFSPAPSAPL